MGDYTSIAFTPSDSHWIADVQFMLGLVETLGVEKFDILTVLKVDPHPQLDYEDEEALFTRYNVSIEEGLRLQHVDALHWTHFMFPLRRFMNGLSGEATQKIPESLYRTFAADDSAVRNGRWRAFSDDDGTLIGSGRFAFTISASGRPANLTEYLDRFVVLDSAKVLRERLAALSGLDWSANISAT